MKFNSLHLGRGIAKSDYHMRIGCHDSTKSLYPSDTGVGTLFAFVSNSENQKGGKKL